MNINGSIDALPPIGYTQPLSRQTRPAGTPSPAGGEPAQVHAANDEEVMAAVDAANRTMAAAKAQVQFTMDQDSGRTLIRIVDIESREVIRQIPSEEMLVIARNIDRLQGLIVHKVA